MVTINEALDIIKREVIPTKKEIVPIEEALFRICAIDIFAQFPLPRFNNSAMDGYVVTLLDVGKSLKVVDTILAGDNRNLVLEKDTTIKIMTGAKMPKNGGAVVPIEDVELNGEFVKFPNEIKKDANIRFVGEDIKDGELLIKKGEQLSSYKIGLLASQGITHIEVFKRVKVSIFATGEELKFHFEHNLEAGSIYNSNTPTLIARAKELGCDVSFIGGTKDSISSIKEAITNSLGADLIITSGGVSVGDADFTKEAFCELGFIEFFSKIKIKPGKPTLFGKIDNSYVLNLPGNPLASSLIFEIFGKTLIAYLAGSSNTVNPYRVKLKESFKNKKGVPTVIPIIFNGESLTIPTKKSPGMVNVMPKCDGFVVLDENVEFVEANETLKFIPFNSFGAVTDF